MTEQRGDGQATSHGRIEMGHSPELDELEVEVDMGSEAGGVRGKAGGGMDKAAETLRRKAWEAEAKGGAAAKAAGAAHRVADELDDAADYVRTHEFGEMKTDLEATVRASPIRSLLVAAAVGFIVGKIVR